MGSYEKFGDLVLLTEDETLDLLRRSDYQDIERAVYGEDPVTTQVREKLMAAMSERVRTFIQEDLQTLNFNQAEVVEARQRLLKISRSL